MWNIFLISTTVVIYNRFAEGLDDGILRLMDGSHSREGRLEIFHSGIWGSVCDDNFGQPDATVACRQLGFRCLSDVQVYTEGGFTSSKIWMDDVNCNGQESSLKTCSFAGWGSNNCGTGENVGIRCYGGCSGDLWLVGGNYYGRLEIYHSGSWGTICDDKFGSQDALVVCKQLGLWHRTKNYRTTIVEFYTAGHGNGTIWLDDVNCNGNENRIEYCQHRGWNVQNCGHGEDVGVRCYGSESSVEVNGHWGSWSLWTSCNSICGSGTRKRTRRCDNPLPTFGGSSCTGNSEQSRTCTGTSCSVRGNWGSWSTWTGCSSSCDSGYQTKHRVCNNPVPSSSGLYCNGTSFAVRNCKIANCPVNGYWGSWSLWTSCNSICGSGTRKRTRRCDNPLPKFGGSSCTGNSEQSRTCTGSSCSVRGNWGSWSAWTGCSSSCDSGYKTKHRVCNNPVPSSSGLYCNGRSFEVRNCNIAKCPVDGSWGHWSLWSECNVTCGGGLQQRTRNCNNPTPFFGGASCTGIDSETFQCSQINCPVDGGWSEWVVWSVCSSSCGSGVKTRTRQCNDPTPSYGGVSCIGRNKDSNSCNTYECPVNGQWGNWQEWDSCITTCGNGFKHRSRKCDSPSSMFGGSECIGFSFDIQNCSQDICPDNYTVGAKQQGNVETSQSFSITVLGSVAAGCIVITAVIIAIALFVFRRFRSGQTAERNKNGTNNDTDDELRDTSRTNNYEFIGPSNGIQNGAYDTYNIPRRGHANTQFNGGNEALYENLKI
ncbi:Neurotrypsin,Scavenger receptor cysteine-rich type 1 protein M130,Deleted in malignant brain tumors 1 protein,Coadhesin,Thrombospondin-1,Mucin-like protein,Hemicentin-1,Thrombospondin-2,Scavenger receptor cysteine-rich domain-containing group B protein,Soluble scavenger receptor cysteine-rich domain-containing protein SSC5D [Mytilus coruscus]|uniref:SRCR domain-containing protein n=1 Tax=Mytilus coruscus TaxID=42192 RepID=A0A6J8EQS5_MYTCO|nr:Neurotrypsin,Scavenger receptor cysteine-rich type 1 protein M130,Deleted in malignant brain tumors 1 protein,Coadhesin,Thrombospondin-1,Mucin-like protein,Hemicentin-1,Thrombospondin-2,Scavenger receptor cysteine-rich domain-containing group B protein,Soluble scavenger receptor cysteine-rich domain-containing protein SSC5D [Mytilus coruscus]